MFGSLAPPSAVPEGRGEAKSTRCKSGFEAFITSSQSKIVFCCCSYPYECHGREAVLRFSVTLTRNNSGPGAPLPACPLNFCLSYLCLPPSLSIFHIFHRMTWLRLQVDDGDESDLLKQALAMSMTDGEEFENMRVSQTPLTPIPVPTPTPIPLPTSRLPTQPNPNPALTQP